MQKDFAELKMQVALTQSSKESNKFSVSRDKDSSLEEKETHTPNESQ